MGYHTVYLTKELETLVRVYMKKTGKSFTKIVQEALMEYLTARI